MVHQGEGVNPRFYKFLFPEDVHQLQAVIFGLHGINGFHNKSFFFVLDKIGIGFTHGYLTQVYF